MGYDNVDSNSMVLGSYPVAVILIQWNYMCDFLVKLSPNFVNKDRNWFCLQPLVLVLSISKP